MQALDYDALELAQQIYQIPDTYIGSDDKSVRREFVYDIATNHIVPVEITLPQAVERLFDEVDFNARDNVERSRKFGVDPGRIEYRVDKQWVTVYNEGTELPVEIHPKFDVYVPQLIFGTLLSSSNYKQEDERFVGGKNGYGAKLCNLFSQVFCVDIQDGKRKMHYTQKWTNNMRICEPPVVTPKEGKSYVRVSYVLDFNRFGYSEYPDEALALFARHAADAAVTCKVPVKFNDICFDFKDPRKYLALYSSLEKPRLAHFKVEGKHEVPDLEIVAMETPEQGKVISFVNHVATKYGGVHADEAMSSISSCLLAIMKEAIAKLEKRKKDETKTKFPLTVADVRPHITLLLICRLNKPKFDSQLKNTLTGPTPDVKPPSNFIKEISDWSFFAYLMRVYEFKMKQKIMKTQGTLSADVDKLVDAPEAAGPNASACILCITEGDSALSYAQILRRLLSPLRIGAYPLRGKPLNVTKASEFEILKNEEFADIRKALHLQEGLDYRDPNARLTLRYGMILIIADADVDGKHINSLMLNFIRQCYPSLLAAGCVAFLRTTLIRGVRGHQKVRFLTQLQFDRWSAQQQSLDGWHFKYFKGLGTSTEEDVIEDINPLTAVTCTYDENVGSIFDLAFKEEFADNRKIWFRDWKPVPEYEELAVLPASYYIANEFPNYCLANIRRSIPSIMDGLKPSQRKILAGILKRWFKTESKKDGPAKKKGEVKLVAFGGFITEHVNYHHGEKSLHDTAIGMGQTFVGSNNLNYIVPKGNYGTRQKGGKDHSNARYLFASPEWWIRYVYRQEDDALLTTLVEDGEPGEPEYYLPIVCMALVDGQGGIASGWSTNLPSYHPMAHTAWIKAKLTGNPLPAMHPFYRGFKGTIQIVSGNTQKPTHASIQNQPLLDPSAAQEVLAAPIDEEDPDVVGDANAKLKMLVTGCFEERGDKIIITELPVQRWTLSYDLWLKKLTRTQTEKGKRTKLLKGFQNHSDDKRVHFELSGLSFNPSVTSLRLQKWFSLSNMVMVDPEGKPMNYGSINAILEAFYNYRLPFYQKRKEHILAKTKAEVDKLNLKKMFIRAVLDKVILVEKRSIADVHADMTRLGFPVDLYNRAKLRSLSEDDIAKLDQKIAGLINAFNALAQKRPEDLWFADIIDFENEFARHPY